MTSIALSEKNLKEKWLRNYQEEIYSNKEKRENDRMKKLVEEKEHLEKIRFELEEENQRKLLKKQNLMYDNQQEFEKFQQKKKLEEQRDLNEKLENQKSLSLPIQHEERMESYRNLLNKLNDKIDSNVNNYKQFTSNNNNNYNNTRFSVSQNYEGVNPDKDLNVDYNRLGGNMEKNFYADSANNQADNRTPDYHNSYNNPSNNYNSHPNAQNPTYDSKGGYLDNLNHQNANDYKNVVRDYLNYNREQVDSKMRNKSYSLQQRKMIEAERLKEMERLKRLEQEEKNFMREQQKVYRDILDSQVKTKAYGGLLNPYFQHNSSASHNQYLNARNNSTNNNNNNNYNSNNPASNQQNEMLSANISNLNPNLFYNNDLDRKFNLGQTKLNHNPITNPVPDFKYNKYLYRDSPPRLREPIYANATGHLNHNNTLSRSLVMTGNNIVS